VTQTAAMLLDQGGHHLAIGRERANRRLLILAHEATIALDIGTQDRCELPLHTPSFPDVSQGALLMSSSACWSRARVFSVRVLRLVRPAMFCTLTKRPHGGESREAFTRAQGVAAQRR